MRRLARSLTRFSVASTLYGAERVAGLLRHGRRSEAAASLDTVTESAASGMSELAHALFHAGDALGREWVDLSADALQTGNADRLIERIAVRSRDGLRFVSLGPEGRADRAELANKMKVYQWVARARHVLGEDTSEPPPALRTTMERLGRLDANSALWLIEGVGYRYAHWHLNARLPGSRVPGRVGSDSSAAIDSGRKQSGGLFHHLDADGVPATWRPLLHAGLGLAIARGRLDALGARIDGREPEDRAFLDAVQRIESLCRAHAEPTMLSIALESFGMVARYFHPGFVAPLDRALRQWESRNGPSTTAGAATETMPSLRTLFWHGCGRGLYFAPVHLLPAYASIDRALDAAFEEAPEDQLEPTLAGLGYAFTLVNLASPEVLESAFLRHGDLIESTAFGTGLRAALVMRRIVTPDSPSIAGLLTHSPEASVRTLWQRWVTDDSPRTDSALGGLYDELTRRAARGRGESEP